MVHYTFEDVYIALLTWYTCFPCISSFSVYGIFWVVGL